MNKPIHPAVAEHVMEENERLRGLLVEVAHCLRTSDEQPLYWEEKFASRIYRDLSQQAEPVEPAPAQDVAEPVYQFQWREIGEGDWMACSHSWFRFCEASPEHDTRVVEVAHPAQPEQSELTGKCVIEVVSGREGPSLYLGDGSTAHRLAGNKPWGGGNTLHAFTVDIAELVREVAALAAQGGTHE